jgi:hypothetical protein
MRYIRTSAEFDDPEHRTYRYSLIREWSPGPHVLFLGLNPSIGDEQRDSRTLRACVRYASEWGYGGLEICNLFGFIDQKNVALYAAPDPVGPRNDAVIREKVRNAVASGGIVVAVWGADGSYRGRDRQVIDLVTAEADLHRIGPPTRGGHPRHPSRLRGGLSVEIHRPRRGASRNETSVSLQSRHRQE